MYRVGCVSTGEKSNEPGKDSSGDLIGSLNLCRIRDYDCIPDSNHNQQPGGYYERWEYLRVLETNEGLSPMWLSYFEVPRLLNAMLYAHYVSGQIAVGA